MKALMWITALTILSGCANLSKLTELTFYDAHGEEYNSSTASSNLKKKFNLEDKPRIVVIATSSKSNQRYKEQISAINKVNAEEMQYLYIVANTDDEDHSGYYMTRKGSKHILAGDIFKVIIYDELGQIIKKSNEVIGVDVLMKHLTR